MDLLRDLCAGVPQPGQHMGSKRFQLADVIFSAAFKDHSTFSGRRFVTDVRDAQAKGYVAKAISYNSLFRYFEDGDLTPILQEPATVSALALVAVETDFAVDSIGFSVSNSFVGSTTNAATRGSSGTGRGSKPSAASRSTWSRTSKSAKARRRMRCTSDC